MFVDWPAAVSPREVPALAVLSVSLVFCGFVLVLLLAGVAILPSWIR